MLPLRLVLDTNIVVSAAIKPEGLQRTVLVLAMARPARLYVTAPILAEYQSVLARPRFQLPKGQRQQFLQLLKNCARVVEPFRTLDVAMDPDDNLFLECAEAARADYLVTGNPRHFPPFWRQTKIISPRTFLTLAAPHLIPAPHSRSGGGQ
ncbi:MAG TPA: putative toxin-antitoxin system toxin component, PIN family [Candidatus Binatia bacterium]|nr:putative toxin-antitoxin system toxin component, PIN family [Candidatus Binatia bacterium]